MSLFLKQDEFTVFQRIKEEMTYDAKVDAKTLALKLIHQAMQGGESGGQTQNTDNTVQHELEEGEGFEGRSCLPMDVEEEVSHVVPMEDF